MLAIEPETEPLLTFSWTLLAVAAASWPNLMLTVLTSWATQLDWATLKTNLPLRLVKLMRAAAVALPPR
jgi:hypothetical protein